MKRTLLTTLAFAMIVFSSCGGDEPATGGTTEGTETTAQATEEHGSLIQPGEVELTTPLNQEWVATGKSIYEMKCQSCHKLTDEKLVGPGWKDITTRREPHWLMNMITNVDIMLEKDAEAQKLLEQCLVRMPNQNVTQEDSRKIIEFMRHNDGVK